MLDPTDLPPRELGPAPAAPGRRSGLLAGGAALAVSATLSNVFGVLITIALAHAYSGSQFGGLVALLSVGLIAAVPATGLQYVIARRTSRAGIAEHAHDRTSLRLAAVLGGCVAIVLMVSAPALSAFLDVPTVAVVLVGLTLAPYMLNSAQLGTLLGHSDYSRFAVGQFVLAGFRFGSVVIASLVHAGLTAMMGWLLVATWLAVLCCSALTGVRTWTVALPADIAFVREIAHATVALAGMSLLINLDILLARHYLSGADSGMYALGALFAKAAFWAAQFVPQLIFPRLAKAAGQRALIWGAVGTDLAVGAAVLIGAALVARPVLAAVSTHADPVGAARLAPLFALLGTAWSLVYLALLASVAARNPVPSRALWIAVTLETGVVAVWAHGSAVVILAVCTLGAGILAVVSVASALWSTRSRENVTPPAG